MADWEIYKPLGECAATGKKIEFGEEYFGALVEGADGLERKDFSAEYWYTEKPDVYCYWKSRLPSPDQKKQIFVDDDMLMGFFERLANETDQERLNFRFVLALILMRKRRLKYDTTVMENGREIWRLKVTGEKRLIQVENPHLNEEEIEALSEQIGQVLHADLKAS